MKVMKDDELLATTVTPKRAHFLKAGGHSLVRLFLIATRSPAVGGSRADAQRRHLVQAANGEVELCWRTGADGVD